jgi:hypothetical protein
MANRVNMEASEVTNGDIACAFATIASLSARILDTQCVEIHDLAWAIQELSLSFQVRTEVLCSGAPA